MTSKMNKEIVTFDKEELKETMNSLKDSDIRCLRNISRGTFGRVIEVNHPKYSENLAAKFIISSHTSVGESIIWKKLSNKNLVPLLEAHHFEYLKTSVYFMPLYKNTLHDITSNEGFRRSESGFTRAVSWSRDVISGISYLHDHGICHLDVKCNNVLVDDSDKALLSDFGFAVKPLTLVERYGSPYIYRPPEAINTIQGLSLVDGYAFDKWTVGILLLELFTCHTLMKIKRDKNTSRVKWSYDIYPEMYSILQMYRFKALLNFGYINSNVSSESTHDVLDIIKNLLSLDPNTRPEMEDVLKYPMFGGTIRAPSVDIIWKFFVEPEEIEKLVGKYAPNPLLGIEELLEIKRAKHELSNQELSLDDSVAHPSERKSDEYSPDVIEEYGELSNQNENVLDTEEKKRTRSQRFLCWVRRKRSQFGDFFRLCISKNSSRNP